MVMVIPLLGMWATGRIGLDSFALSLPEWAGGSGSSAPLLTGDNACPSLIEQKANYRDRWTIVSSATASRPYHPSAVAVDGDGALYVAAGDSPLLQKFSPSGRLVAEWTPATDRSTGYRSIGVGPDGAVYLIDVQSRGVYRTSVNGSLTGFGGATAADTGLKQPTELDVDRKGDIYVVERSAGRVSKFAPSGNVLRRWGIEADSPLRGLDLGPVSVDDEGAIYQSVTVSLSGEHKVLKLTAAGKLAGEWSKFTAPSGLSVGWFGAVYVMDSGAGHIKRITRDGTVAQEPVLRGRHGQLPRAAIRAVATQFPSRCEEAASGVYQTPLLCCG
ncbi:MAG: NHL repeat-containing protein [Chloroflexi bacterium]|nr:NHL repeat-containing protein [Chloroflexota bacterium]